ncbi:MAG: peptidase E [Actinomycetota bacterium]|nr:peptidase E [Actinomycetota bacterium]
MSHDGHRHILAIGGGGFVPTERYGARPGPLVDHALSLTGAERPKVCALYTATADDPARIAAFYAAWAGTAARPSHLALFPMPSVDDVRAHLLSQDAVYVGGGSVANLLAVWRVHGLDEVMREAWHAGVVLFGVSAGSLCWFAGGTTDSFGPQLRPFANGLGLLPTSNCPHYDSERRRRPLYQQLVASGELPGGMAADDGVGLHYVDDELAGAVADRPGAGAWRVERDAGGTAVETRVEPRLL